MTWVRFQQNIEPKLVTSPWSTLRPTFVPFSFLHSFPTPTIPSGLCHGHEEGSGLVATQEGIIGFTCGLMSQTPLSQDPATLHCWQVCFSLPSQSSCTGPLCG